jgi:hypothetical protein
MSGLALVVDVPGVELGRSIEGLGKWFRAVRRGRKGRLSNLPRK